MLTFQIVPNFGGAVLCVGGAYVFVKPKSEFLGETLLGGMHDYWDHQLVLVDLIAARLKLLLIVW